MVQKLREESKRFHDMSLAEKNLKQKIRLIINQILPDNFDKKFAELRDHIFGSLKHQFEEGYSQEVDQFTMTEEIKSRLLEVVERIYTKAQREKTYCTFYGELTERIVRLELNFKGHVKATVNTIK